ncbi:MAG: hypothetical protein ABR499_12210, partial [Gemmatimonadaceae bacterium]
MMMVRRAIVFFPIAASVGILAGCRGKPGDEHDTDARAATSPATSVGKPAAAAAGVPATVEAIGHHAENAFDMAKLGDWAKARASTDSLRPAIDALPGPAGVGGASRDDVVNAFGELQRAVTTRDRMAALRASNRLTELGARLSAPFQPQVPPEVTLLDYYGRELEIWAAAGNRAKLRETASALRQTWDAVRPRVEARGGAREAARFNTLVARVGAAA